jgi:hypothetical protein
MPTTNSSLGDNIPTEYVDWPNHNQGPRHIYQYNGRRQAMGIYNIDRRTIGNYQNNTTREVAGPKDDDIEDYNSMSK